MIYKKQYIVWLAINSYVLSLIGAASDTPAHLFAPDEYEHYMQLIKEVSPKVHMQLRNCANELGEPCVEKSENSTSYVVPGTSLSNGHPLIIFASIRNKSVQAQKKIISLLVAQYTKIKDTLPITKTETKDILNIIKEIAPELYSKLSNLNEEVIHPYTQKKLTHTVQDHIRRYYNNGFAINVCPFDGLPIIWVDQDSFIDNPDPEEQFKAAIAHELGHYVSKHLIESDQTRLKQFEKAYLRTHEYEADRSMVLDFDIPINIAIENAQTLQQQDNDDIQTITSTHPLWVDRIKHIESLQAEVELKKAHSRGKTHFNWQTLADEYLQEINKK